MLPLLFAAGQGFLLGASLIIAIGAQNAFVLRQGLLRRHVLVLALFGTLSDAALIAVGAAGFGSLVADQPLLLLGVGIGGCGFLAGYGVLALANGCRRRTLSPADGPAVPLGRALALMAAFTFLNPHVYLDTVLLLGGIAGRLPLPDRVWFAGGAMVASAVWFFSLAYGARLLAPLFARPVAWRVLDLLIGGVMVSLAAGLATDLLARGH